MKSSFKTAEPREHRQHHRPADEGFAKKRLEAKQISLELTDRAKQLIIDEAYDPIYGARPLKRYLQSHVETMLGRKIIAGEIGSADQNGEGCRVQIDAENGELVVR